MLAKAPLLVFDDLAASPEVPQSESQAVSAPGKGLVGRKDSGEGADAARGSKCRLHCWLGWTDADRKLSDTLSAYWTNFARTGDPNGVADMAGF
jgi:hypothetical protein